MKNVKAYAAQTATTPLKPITIERREPGSHDVVLEIVYSGICHSDIHQARDEWGGSIFPMVPGHEIAGRVVATGSSVSSFKTGDLVGVGCFVDSCRACRSCEEGVEQYCERHLVQTYNSVEKDGKTPTFGGYSTHMVVDEKYALRIPSNLDLSKAAPLLCAGITTYSPLKHWKVSQGQRVGVVGLGGLGHMAIKFAAAFGAEVTVFSHSPKKEEDAKRLGAQHFVVTSDADALKKHAGRFDFVLDAVSAPHDLGAYLSVLRRDGVMVLVGVPPEATKVHASALIMGRKTLAGSLIGGIKETQEMLDYCGEKNITCDVEVIAAGDINTAYERMIRGDVRYRFVIDAKTF